MGLLRPHEYYRKFVKGYGEITRPLTNMLKKNQFQWSKESVTGFDQLKAATGNTLVLALPDFSKPFILETDASQLGIRTVLMQCGRPIAFLSKALPLRNIWLSTYEKELLDLIYTVEKWRTYLVGHNFVIKIDH